MRKFLQGACSATFALAMIAQALPACGQQAGGSATPMATQAQPVNPPATAAFTMQPQAMPAASESSVAAGDGVRPILGLNNLRELSPWSMFLSADSLVKLVIISLLFASLVTWTILLAKTVQLSKGQRQLSVALARISEAKSLGEAQLALGSTTNVLTALLSAAGQEVRLSADSVAKTGIKERAASRFSEIVRMEIRAIRYGIGVIATIGATAPFVGLFGTVWGIMNSFIGISTTHTTNLAVVAPGIAEALLATAVGLAAAIPAVIIYNHFSRVIKSYADLVGRGSGAVGRLLSRDLDRFRDRMMPWAAE